MSEIIDTPAEGFPLPTMTPPRRTLRDVARLLTPGIKARAVQRAATMQEIGDAIGEGLEEGLRQGEHLPTVADLFDRETGIPFTMDVDTDRDPSVITTIPGYRPRFSVLDTEIARRVGVRTAAALAVEASPVPAMTAHYLDNLKAQADRDLANAFDAGRAYERGATLRRGVGKSFGSRRVQAEGIAGDYLRDDPERGALHAAMVLAGFTGADPATVTA